MKNGSRLEPLPRNISTYALGRSLIDVIPMTTVKSIGRNLSRGGLPGAPQPFFNFQERGLNPDFWSLQWSKWKNFRVRRGSWSLLANACLRLWWQYMYCGRSVCSQKYNWKYWMVSFHMGLASAIFTLIEQESTKITPVRIIFSHTMPRAFKLVKNKLKPSLH